MRDWGASCNLVVRSQANREVKRSAADVPKCSDEGKRQVKWHSAGRQAVFMDVISLMV